MATNIYVGNLSYKVNEEELGELFSQFGKVDSAKVIRDRESGNSRGFGFVEMATDEDAQKAIEKLDGDSFEGRNLVVNVARPRRERRERFSQPRRERSW